MKKKFLVAGFFLAVSLSLILFSILWAVGPITVGKILASVGAFGLIYSIIIICSIFCID